ncbi:Hypothetical protein SRAE_2000372500 [Strongyloides ratti]|uniref:Nematode fatty acid retinoid binding family-containing protein n=1 Tax=Strongyloides ratti TaxID=34506 RepID=A0A090LLM2_STRRB|nr:Hypothetical protein SRAE_2000372500 [Strongyloides ratti]CEF69073.1 Hypothetical protein SRAE_2000372500 [Strongyloides ratti]
MTKSLLLTLALISLVSLPVFSTNTNGGFYLLLKKKTGINWNDEQISLLGNLSGKVFEEFKDVFVKNNNKRAYLNFIQQFVNITNSNKDVPDNEFLFKLVGTTSENLNSSSKEIKEEAQYTAENLLNRMSIIVSQKEYKEFQKLIVNVVDFSKNEDGSYKKYSEEISKLVKSLGKEGKNLFTENGKSARLREFVLDFLENKFLNVILEFVEECPILIEDTVPGEFDFVRPIANNNQPILKKCAKKYFKKLYDGINLINNPEKFKGQPIYKFVKAYKKMDEAVIME